MPARFAVGIDLGTTHTVVASALLDGAEPPRVFDVPQLVGAAEVEARSLLPSMLYAPLEGEHVEDPFEDAPWVLGELARRRGTDLPGRLIASSKSWLAHTGVDRTASILPWGAGEGTPKLSPLAAASRLLTHVRRVWDRSHPDALLAEQDVVLTVPASFDEVGRELTLEAARAAGVEPKLLEEPQAAFYAWMAHVGPLGLDRLLAATGGEALVLVVDVGGGTTDLSLVRIVGQAAVARVAVGPHLLLGGDNMDLALAHAVEPRLLEAAAAGEGGEAADRLPPAQFAQLVAACRQAKERLLGAGAPPEVPVTIATRSARLVGGALTARLSREEAERIVLDGFLPWVPAELRPQRARAALVAFGLPYEPDVAITRHVAGFLGRHLRPGSWPHALLLNGGVFRAERVATRMVDSVARWRGRGESVVRLADADPDRAVAEGAVAYALARRGRGVRIGGGTARGYFVGVSAEGAACAPQQSPARAVCVVPRGADEGTAYVAAGRAFAMAVGRPARFEMLASDRVDACAGDVVDVDEERFARLPPLVASVGEGAGAPHAEGAAASARAVVSAATGHARPASEGGTGDRTEREVAVAIEGELTAVGTLDLACVEIDGARRRFRLAFQLRAGDAPPLKSAPPSSRRLEMAIDAIDRAFGKPRAGTGGREAKDLLRELERVLGERSQWTTETSRALFDVLLATARARRRSADHERLFWLLAGWCIRPGFGDPRDGRRLAALTPLFEERLAFPAEARGWQQFWIAWRRAAGGIEESMQTQIRDAVDPYLAPTQPGAKRPKRPALALDDALDMASSLERVDPGRRAALGGWVLERTWTSRDPRLWCAMGRLGARTPAYASIHHVVPPYVAERWLDHMLREKWDVVPAAMQAAVRLARRTGDRSRDIGESARREVEQRLVAARASEGDLRVVREVVPVEESERATFFGDTLPLGLRLMQ